MKARFSNEIEIESKKRGAGMNAENDNEKTLTDLQTETIMLQPGSEEDRKVDHIQ